MKPKRYQFEYRSPEEAAKLATLIASVATLDSEGRSTPEQPVEVPLTQTRQGKGHRRKTHPQQNKKHRKRVA